MAKILIIEDDPALGNLLYKRLQAENYEVVWSVNGENGLKEMEGNKPDLVLLDLMLPDIYGFEVLERKLKNDSISQIPVMILSNLYSENDIARCKSLGAIDYLIKANFLPEEIIQKIKGAIK